MTFNALNQYTGVHKVWDHVGNIIPDIEHCEGERGGFPFKPAPWLPVQFYDKYYENWYVIMPGKLLALDPYGYLMPAQYGLTGQTVTYTQNDVDAGVIDIATGSPVTTPKTVTLSQLTGTHGAGWTAANAGVSVTSSFMGRQGVGFDDGTKKYPFAVAFYGSLQWAGDASEWDDGFNPTAFREHNYNMQHAVSTLYDYVIKLPLIPGKVASESVSQVWNASAITFGTADGWRDRTHIQATGRYNASTGHYPCLSTYEVAALPLDNIRVAKNTPRTQITSTASGLLVTEMDSMAGIQQAGDYWVDYEVGVVFVYSAGGSTLPVSGASTIQYFHYNVAPSVVSKFACVTATTTELKPGDFLKCDSNSNWVRGDPASDTAADLVGQVMALDNRFPKDYLEYVRTAYNPALRTDASGGMANGTASSASTNRGQLDQMSGSATEGIPTLITYAGGANTLVYINLIRF